MTKYSIRKIGKIDSTYGPNGECDDENTLEEARMALGAFRKEYPDATYELWDNEFDIKVL